MLQPFADQLSLYELLGETLRDPAYSSLTIVVAWAKAGGISRIASSLAAFRSRASSMRILLGIDEGGATREGLEAAIEAFSEAYVLFDPAAGTFHPKMYLLSGNRKAFLVVGSNNLTAGGLYANYEVAIAAELERDREDDRVLLDEAINYVERLLADRTVQPLTDALIGRLLEDRRFVIASEAQPRRFLGTQVQASDSLGVAEDADFERTAPFRSSMHARKRDPGRPDVARDPRTSRTTTGLGAALLGGSDADVLARWTKKMSRSDCAQPRPGSQTTAALRFTKAGHPIDQTLWFRHRLFGEADWQPDERRPNREQAFVSVDVSVNGISRGTHEVLLKHDSSREAGQHNFTTDLKWRSLTPILREEDLTGEYVIIEKLSDGSYRLIVQREAPPPFI